MVLPLRIVICLIYLFIEDIVNIIQSSLLYNHCIFVFVDDTDRYFFKAMFYLTPNGCVYLPQMMIDLLSYRLTVYELLLYRSAIPKMFPKWLLGNSVFVFTRITDFFL